MNFEGIPPELQTYQNWVCWKTVVRNGKPTKPPINPRTGDFADSSDPSTWGTVSEALTFFQKHKNNGIEGVGFEFGKTPSDTSYAGIDLDNCRDPETGYILPWAKEVIDEVNSYTEISPSGTGVHIIAVGALPGRGRKKDDIEMYDSGRYFTFTGRHLAGTFREIKDRDSELKAAYSRYFGEEKTIEQATGVVGVRLDDETVLQKARNAKNGEKFNRLWAGDSTDYHSRSEAHLALCSQLAFWTKDPVQIDGLFRRSGFYEDYKEKWDTRHHANGNTYGKETIRRAIAETPETYNPQKQVAVGTSDEARSSITDHTKVGDVPPASKPTKPDPADPSIFLSVGSLLDIEEPDRPDLWEGEIPQGALVGISGPWGSMKSYLMQAFGLRAAEGVPFLERRLLPVHVFYFDRENPKSVWKRRMVDFAGTTRPERFHMMTLFGPVIPPVFDADGVAFYSKLAELHPGSLFIFDSLVRYYPTGKQTENTEDAIHAMTALKTLTRWGTTVDFLHHPTKTGSDFRGGGDLQAAPDLLFALSHDKRNKRLSLKCTKNRFEEEHTIQIGYEVTPEGGLTFVDLATAEEMKRREETRQRTASVFEIVKELHWKRESIKTRLFEECKKRLNLGRRVIEQIIDNNVDVMWTYTKEGTKHIYAPLCTPPVYTNAEEHKENPLNNEILLSVHAPKIATVHNVHDPSCSCTSCTESFRTVHVYTKGGDSQTQDEDFPPEEDTPDVEVIA